MISCLPVELKQTLIKINPSVLIFTLIAHILLIINLWFLRETTEITTTVVLTALNLMHLEPKLNSVDTFRMDMNVVII